MDRYAYSLDGERFKGGYESREAAAFGCVADHPGEFEAGKTADIITAVAQRAPLAGDLLPTPRELLDLLIGEQIEDGEFPEQAGEWWRKLDGLPDETIERLKKKVSEAVDTWVGQLGLQPKFFTVEKQSRVSIRVPLVIDTRKEG